MRVCGGGASNGAFCSAFLHLVEISLDFVLGYRFTRDYYGREKGKIPSFLYSSYMVLCIGAKYQDIST